MLDCCVDGQQFAPERAVTKFSGRQFSGEESSWSPHKVVQLQHCGTHSCVRGVDRDALRDSRLGACEECGITETVLDPLKSCCRVVGVKGMQDGRALGNEAPIKVHQPKKLAELMPRVWLGKISDGSYLLRRWSNPRARDEVAEKRQLANTELALRRVHYNPMLRQALESGPQVLLVLLRRATCDEQVVEVGVAKLEAVQDAVDEALERLT